MDALAALADQVVRPLIWITVIATIAIVASAVGGIIYLAKTRPRAHDDEYGEWGDTGSWRGNNPTPDDED